MRPNKEPESVFRPYWVSVRQLADSARHRKHLRTLRVSGRASGGPAGARVAFRQTARDNYLSRGSIEWTARSITDGGLARLMYYRNPSGKLQQTSRVVVNGTDVIIHIGDPERRFRWTGCAVEAYAKSVADVLDQLQVPPDERRAAKRALYNATRELFRQAEDTHPDSTKGVIPFLEGKPYRTPWFDLTGNITYTIPDGREQRMHVTVRGPYGAYDADFPYDVLALMDVVFAVIDEAPTTVTHHDHSSQRLQFSIIHVSRAWNRIVLDTPVGRVTAPYDDFLVNVLRAMDQINAKSISPLERYLCVLYLDQQVDKKPERQHELTRLRELAKENYAEDTPR